jgi:predicted phosphodiesterase
LRTLIVSDLHLGSAARVDVLRRPEPRARLLEALRDVDRLVLLGDLLELRHGPRHEALAAARPFFEDLGRAFAGREVVAVAGNHDHALIEPWLEHRGELSAPPALGVEQRMEATAASSMMTQLAEWTKPARLTVAYPGLWVRPDVYATHGHYLDCHLTIPTLERLGIGAMGRMMRRPARSFARPEDYEAVTVPVFAWIDAIARQAPTGDTLNGGMTVRAWRAFGGDRDRAGRAPTGIGSTLPAQPSTDGGRNTRLTGGTATPGDGLLYSAELDRRPVGADPSRADGYRRRVRATGRALRGRALAGALPLAVAALNRAGLGPFNADISTGELRRAGLRAMGEVAARLDLNPPHPAHVVFGHTHRAGPLPGDRESEWRGRGGARLTNTGCWTYDAYFLTSTPGESPYWPGSCVLIEDDGPPILWRLLENCPHAELRPSLV